MAGEGWERPYLDALVEEHQVRDLVQFLGVLGDEELVACYQQCDLFALPNRQVEWDLEGFGIVLLEAQACGKPVIAGLSGGTADALQPGMTGEMIACESPEPLAEAVAGLLTDTARARQMGTRARDWVVERFDWGSLSREAMQIFLASVGR
jgi:phosphatidylinositol alpha-1,6-mannosyltransferase